MYILHTFYIPVLGRKTGQGGQQDGRKPCLAARHYLANKFSFSLSLFLSLHCRTADYGLVLGFLKTESGDAGCGVSGALNGPLASSQSSAFGGFYIPYAGHGPLTEIACAVHAIVRFTGRLFDPSKPKRTTVGTVSVPEWKLLCFGNLKSSNDIMRFRDMV